VPVVVVPLSADQFANGARVAEAGAGVVVDTGANAQGRRRLLSREDAPRIADAITAVSDDSSYRRQAQRLAAEMREANTVGDLFDELVVQR